MRLSKKSKASFSLAAFSFSATGQLPEQRTHQLTTKTPWQSISFGERPPSTSPRSSDRHAIVRENCFVLVFVETVFRIFICMSVVFLLVLLKCHFGLDCTPLFTSTVWKISAYFSPVNIFNVIFFWTLSWQQISKLQIAKAVFIFSSTPSYDFVSFLSSA